MTSLQNTGLGNSWSTPNGKPTVNMELQVKFSKNGGRPERENSHTRLKLNESSISSESGSSNSARSLPAEPGKTVLSFLLMMCVFACNLFFTGVIHDRTPIADDRGPTLQRPLRDISLDVSERLLNVNERLDANKFRYTLLTISEVLIVGSTAVLVFVLCFHEHRSIIFRRMFFLLTLLFAVRLISMNVTILPISSEMLFEKCDAKSAFFEGGVLASRFLQLATSCGLANIKYCGNYVFSGHTVVFVLNCLMAGEYCPVWIVVLPLRLIAVCGVALILMSEYDYTISIITAYYITTRLFWVYHTLANNASLKNVHEFGLNQICKEWWYPIFRYLEGRLKAVVPPMRPSLIR